MSYYIKCPNCGANLDPGEKCDCKTEKGNIEPAQARNDTLEYNNDLKDPSKVPANT